MRNSIKNILRKGMSLMMLAMVAMSTSVAYAQSQKVTGTVYDENGDPAIGASVIVAGTKVGTNTDVDGKFTLPANKGQRITVSYVGYRNYTFTVKNAGPYTIDLVQDPSTLNEVVVTALGLTRDAKSLSYARQAIDPESMTEVRGTNLLDMLTGKAAGMQVISGGGPTASTRIVLRGLNSLTGNNQPLFVVDGVPILNNMGGDGDLDYGNPANNINPDEIENIEVLKGANASALYGSDAANGVIIITTKKGEKKKGVGVTYGFNLMLGYLYNYPTYQNIYGTGQSCLFERYPQGGGWNVYGAANNGMVYDPELPYGIWNPNMAGVDQRSWGLPMLGFDVVGRNGEIKKFEPHPETTKSMYGTSQMYTNSVAIDKVFDGASFRLSYTNILSDDILKGVNDMNRHTFNLNTHADITKWFNIDAQARYVYEHVKNRAFRNASNRNPIYLFANLPRDAMISELKPWKQPDGTAFNFNGFVNPFWVLNECDNEDSKDWFMGNIALNFKPYRMVNIRLRAATDLQSSEGWSFTNLYSPFDRDGEYYRWNRLWRNNNLEGLVTFRNNFVENKLSVDASLGASYQDIQGSQMQSRATQLQFSDMRSLSNAKGLVSALESTEKKRKEAVYGTGSIGWDDMVFVNGTARNEWSSALPKDNNSYFYWSAGVGVLANRIFKLDPHWFPMLKLRASYAKVGNDTGYDRLVSGYYKSNDGSFLGIPFYVGDDVLKTMSLRPEQTNSFEVGTELHFYDNRVTVDFTYYSKETIDQIVEADAPVASGYQREIINAGRMTNEGVELSVTVVPIRTQDWDWSVTFNWAKNHNMVRELAPGVERFQISAGDNIQSYAQVGKPYGVFYGNNYKTDDEGHICVARDGRIMYRTDQYLGSIQPDWIGGAQTTLRWKNLSIGAALDFQYGGKFWSYTSFRGGIDGNVAATLKGRFEFTESKLVYGENDREREGFLEPQYTNKVGADYAENYVMYPDYERQKGIMVPNTVYDETLEYWAGKPAMCWVTPMVHWCHNNQTSSSRYIYDATYVKLREVSLGYSLPTNWLRKTFLTGVKLSVVGRNVAILKSNAPKGMDPQATSSTGNDQGFERGFTLPMATWGFDLKVTF